MAKHLDLEEQEQLDQIKHFWAKYGNAITWVLIVVLGAFAAWNGWNWWQRSQSAKASALHTEIERAAQAKDSARLDAALADMQATAREGAPLGVMYVVETAAVGVATLMIGAFGTVALAGNQAPYIANNTVNAGIQYRTDITSSLGLFIRGDFENRGRQFWDPENSTARSAIQLVNARIGIEDLDIPGDKQTLLAEAEERV